MATEPHMDDRSDQPFSFENPVPAPSPAPYSYFPTPTPAQPHAEVGDSPSEVMHWIAPLGRSTISVVAGYVALFALFIWILGPLSLWLGIRAFKARKNGGNGTGRAVFAIIVGALATFLCIFGPFGIVAIALGNFPA